LNDIQFRIATRYGFVHRYVEGEIKECEHNTDFYDIVIDGLSLYGIFKEYDFISVFSQEYDEQILENIKKNFLLESPFDSELEDGRYFLFVCPMCADLGCGAVTVRIQQEQERIVWSDFRYEDHQTSRPLDMNTYRFDRKEYAERIRSLTKEE